MRTKTLLIAAAALAAGVMTSQAQVYSQNVVGYVNQTVSLGNNFLVNPLVGVTNDLEQTLNLQGGETILVYVPGGYQVYVYQQGAAAGGYPSDWTDGGGVAIPGTVENSGFPFVPDPKVAPGQGFIIQEESSAFTNTWVGSVVLSSTNALTSGNNLIGSILPVAGDLETNTTINLPFFGGETILVWGPGGYYVYVYQQGAAAGGYPSDWTDGGGLPIPGEIVNYQGSGFTFAPNPQISVGQAVFYQTENPATNWVQNLILQ
jgi:hypothetical protein